jgi:hypothetical protein
MTNNQPTVKVAQGATSVRSVHNWFELTYAQYLTIPRSILEAMPVEWQQRMVACLEELDATFDWRPKEGRYWVQLKNGQGKYWHDPLMQYRHPDTDYIESLRQQKSPPAPHAGVGSERD